MYSVDIVTGKQLQAFRTRTPKEEPDGDTEDCIRFLRELKRLPEAEIIGEHYAPVRKRAQMYGGAAGGLNFRPPLGRMGQRTMAALGYAERPDDASVAAAYQDNGSTALNW